ncbi:purine-nucleoside phosphorylase [Paenalcaligenes hominis]|uniref:Purine-nucleoside phosphorylase n=1 Tax=Paenalcaligenes hominis TaxID=643674 RepID=A0A1U9K0Q2_9BURK|nr:DUF523 domain-containing protein [Paenalcaligenes hominis]AQS51564.1 purine-nucleoside phosphorylase [Paenalcaligenes hominis]
MTPILISACLVGQPVRYDHSHKRIDHTLLERWREEGRLIPICPEVAAGLPTPRPPAEIQNKRSGEDILAFQARIIDSHRHDLTAEFIAGAQLALELAQRHQVPLAILKENSPSCGSSRIYDGSFTGTTLSGMGVTAALLTRHRIRVFNENQLEEAAAFLARYDA